MKKQLHLFLKSLFVFGWWAFNPLLIDIWRFSEKEVKIHPDSHFAFITRSLSPTIIQWKIYWSFTCHHCSLVVNCVLSLCSSYWWDFNPSHATGLFLYPLKTSENLWLKNLKKRNTSETSQASKMELSLETVNGF